jgi:hypothetical protein
MLSKIKGGRDMSFKLGVKTSGDKDWVYNGLRFSSKEEADDYGTDLMRRWFAVTEWESHESTDPVTHSFVDGKLEEVKNGR